MSTHNDHTALAAMEGEILQDRNSHTKLKRERPGAIPRSASRRLVPTKIALAVLIGAALLAYMPAVAQAGPLPATITLSSDLFPSGAAVPGGVSGTIPVPGGSSVAITAPQYVYQPPTPPATVGSVYEFMFWDVNATLITTEDATFTSPSTGGTLDATAWYLPICVVSSSCGGGSPQVTTWAFSLTNYDVLPGTPISSVTPITSPPAWTSPSATVSTATAVQIAAFAFLGIHNKYSATAFSSWFVFGGTSAVTISGLDLQVPADESPYAIAFYKQYTASPPPPEPCPGYPHCV